MRLRQATPVPVTWTLEKEEKLTHNKEVLSRLLHEYFYFSQVGLGVLFILGGWYFLKGREPESQFRVREADRIRSAPAGASSDQDLASAKMKRNEPLRLGGIRIDGEPHEVLGVRADAGPADVQRAYRELMKRYHPDLVGRPGTREWNDAQKIAEAINRAKETLLRQRKS